jgi:hypothetical protein
MPKCLFETFELIVQSNCGQFFAAVIVEIDRTLLLDPLMAVGIPTIRRRDVREGSGSEPGADAKPKIGGGRRDKLAPIERLEESGKFGLCDGVALLSRRVLVTKT